MSAPLHRLQADAAEYLALLGHDGKPEEIVILVRGERPVRIRCHERKRKASEVQIIQALRSAGKPRAPKDIATDTGLSESTIYAALRALESRGDIEPSGNGYQLAR